MRALHFLTLKQINKNFVKYFYIMGIKKSARGASLVDAIKTR